MLTAGILMVLVVAHCQRLRHRTRLRALALPDVVPRGSGSRSRSRGAGATGNGGGSNQYAVAMAADLLDELFAAGSSLTSALAAVGRYEPWHSLSEVATLLENGTPWRRAWHGVPLELRKLEAALAASWHSGAAPSTQLRVLSRAQREQDKKDRVAAAGRLGVWMLLPLGLCYLPAFILVAVIPLLLGLAEGFFR